MPQPRINLSAFHRDAPAATVQAGYAVQLRRALRLLRKHVCTHGGGCVGDGHCLNEPGEWLLQRAAFAFYIDAGRPQEIVADVVPDFLRRPKAKRKAREAARR